MMRDEKKDPQKLVTPPRPATTKVVRSPVDKMIRRPPRTK